MTARPLGLRAGRHGQWCSVVVLWSVVLCSAAPWSAVRLWSVLVSPLDSPEDVAASPLCELSVPVAAVVSVAEVPVVTGERLGAATCETPVLAVLVLGTVVLAAVTCEAPLLLGAVTCEAPLLLAAVPVLGAVVCEVPGSVVPVCVPVPAVVAVLVVPVCEPVDDPVLGVPVLAVPGCAPEFGVPVLAVPVVWVPLVGSVEWVPDADVVPLPVGCEPVDAPVVPPCPVVPVVPVVPSPEVVPAWVPEPLWDAPVPGFALLADVPVWEVPEPGVPPSSALTFPAVCESWPVVEEPPRSAAGAPVLDWPVPV
ncbi:MAG TPA: hypothetical protein VH008_02155 [Pseudonocardia sp.]|nr:hypothetical protein [Pseudonocardia sp.]